MRFILATITSLSSIGSIDPANDVLPIVDVSLNTTFKVTPNALFGITGSVVGTTDSQTVSSKIFSNTNFYTIKDGALTLQNSSDITKQAVFSLANVTTSSIRTYTMPNASVTLASLTGVETLTNKTVTNPTITGGSIDNSTITVDSISGHTTPTVVTIGGVQMNNGIVATAGAVNTNSIAAGAVVPNSLLASTGSGWAMTSFTPTYTGFTLGNGTVDARYLQMGKFVFVRMVITLGSSSSMSGLLTGTLPVTAQANYALNFQHVGIARFVAAAVSYTGQARLSDATHFQFTVSGAAATYTTEVATSSTIPGTWAAADSIVSQFWYEAA